MTRDRCRGEGRGEGRGGGGDVKAGKISSNPFLPSGGLRMARTQ